MKTNTNTNTKINIEIKKADKWYKQKYMYKAAIYLKVTLFVHEYNSQEVVKINKYKYTYKHIRKKEGYSQRKERKLNIKTSFIKVNR